MRFIKASTSSTPGIPRNPTVSQSFGKTTTKLMSLITVLKTKFFFCFVFYTTFLFLYNHIYGYIFYITWGSWMHLAQQDAAGICPKAKTPHLATCKTHKKVSKSGCRMLLLCVGRIGHLVCTPLPIRRSPQSLYKNRNNKPQSQAVEVLPQFLFL